MQETDTYSLAPVYTSIRELWLAHAKQNYDMQKNTQGVGLIGFGIILLMIWKWNEWFYPLFNALGLVALNGALSYNCYGNYENEAKKAFDKITSTHSTLK